MRVSDLYRQAADRDPDGVALRYLREPYAGQTRTWRQVADAADRYREQLRAAGVPRGARVAVVLGDDPQLIAWLVALWEQGNVVVPVDAAWGAALRGHVVEHAGTDWTLSAGELARRPRSGTVPVPVPAGTALVAYTSGSTGNPKGVVLGHRALLHAYRTAAAHLRAELAPGPLTFASMLRMSGLGVLGMNFLFAAALGATVAVLPELTLATGRDVWARVREVGAGLLYLVPAQLELILRIARPPTVPLADVVCLTGSAPIRPQLYRSLTESTGLILLNAYGMTEVAFAAFFGRRGALDIGKPVTVTARVRGDGGAEILDGPGIGELELTGPSMADGYLGNPAETAAVFAGGWVRSGDRVRRDADGNYEIIGRAKRMVLKGGFSIYLDEIESYALDLPEVAAAVAVEDATQAGEDFELIVEPVPGATPHDTALRRRLVEMVGATRAPRRVLISDVALPRTGQHKVDRPAVRRLWERLRWSGES